MTHVWDRLWIGNLRDAEELADANPHCITAVISLCEVCITAKRRGVRYVHIPIEDAEPVPARKFDAIINSIAQNICRGTVLLHCAEGVSRAPSLTAAYMHRVGYRKRILPRRSRRTHADSLGLVLFGESLGKKTR